jgi:hypothetical protein
MDSLKRAVVEKIFLYHCFMREATQVPVIGIYAHAKPGMMLCFSSTNLYHPLEHSLLEALSSVIAPESVRASCNPESSCTTLGTGTKMLAIEFCRTKYTVFFTYLFILEEFISCWPPFGDRGNISRLRWWTCSLSHCFPIHGNWLSWEFIVIIRLRRRGCFLLFTAVEK